MIRSAEEVARGTATVAGFEKKPKQARPVTPPQPLVERGKLYLARAVQLMFEAADTTFADWKRRGLKVAPSRIGDVVTGDAVIDFFEQHEVRPPRRT